MCGVIGRSSDGGVAVALVFVGILQCCLSISSECKVI